LEKGGRVTSMGYGWYTSTLTEESNLPVVWINGGTGGFRSFIGFIKDTNTAVVVLSNSTNGVDEMGFEILELLNAQTKKKVVVNK
jgi:D-alanyl-D-alanine-carboxypeptidase/D-alanyl-D-alanine-endopeptidase